MLSSQKRGIIALVKRINYNLVKINITIDSSKQYLDIITTITSPKRILKYER